ncbi:MAG TPA: alkaline phosphatase family protein [Solirubrobacteraceae bacterium]|nr:alkaline phosphatase family protein [Solirubrobacteraceae bacterium]
MQYDNYKVRAVLRWIDGLNHQGTKRVGVPALFGMNFQTVSTAEKLKTSDGLNGGYLPGTTTPGPLLVRALQYLNDQVGRMVNEIKRRSLESSTAIIISAKHGQSPQNPNQLTRIDDTPIINGANAVCGQNGKPIVAFGTDDDAIMWWLTNTSQASASCVRNYLWGHPATGVTYSGGSRTLQHSGLRKIYTGQAAATYFGVPKSDPRHPDVWGVVHVGVVYTTGTKIAEHGGANPEDRDVPILVYAPGAVAPGSHSESVETTQIAPTILHLLGLNPNELQAVRIEGTKILPGS